MEPLTGIRRAVLAALLASMWLLPAGASAEGTPPDAPDPASASVTMPAWLEPEGLNIVDLVGFVPDEYLNGAILAWATGIVQYVSGTRSGDQVTLRVKISPRIFGSTGSKRTAFDCLGQRAYADGWASAAPESRLKLYAGGTEITSRLGLSSYAQGGPIQPVRGALDGPYSRYRFGASALTFDAGWAVIPANRGCTLWVPGEYPELTADFAVRAHPTVRVETLGQQYFQFSSYIGPGNLGWFKSVIDQLHAAGWGDRDFKFDLSLPQGANYLLLNYPPMQVDPYTGCCTRSAENDQNIARPSGGSYRVANRSGQLSVDLQSVMGIPVGGQWQDADQVGGTSYLPHFSNGRTLTAPEYVVPAGIAFQPCLRDGNCPADHSIIDKIGHATMPLTVTYLSITRLSAVATRVPLRQVGSSWSPAVASGNAVAAAQDVVTAADWKYHFFLVGVYGNPAQADDPSGCPCGWFTADGRMVDYTPGR